MTDPEVNRPDIRAEVEAVFNRYEKALVSNDVAVLDELFHESDQTVRYGPGEHLYGFDAIQDFRQQRNPQGLARTLTRVHIVTYGTDFATVWTEFERPGESRIGRQTQAWVRFPAGWRIVAAHVSWSG